MSSYLFQKREKRLEARNRSRNTCKLWNDFTPDNENADDICNSFIKLKNLLQSEKASKRIEYDDYNDSDSVTSSSHSNIDKESISSANANITEDIDNINLPQNELLSKKTYRDTTEELPFIPELLADESVGPEPIKVELDKKEERRFYAGSGLKREEAELFAHYVKEGKRIPRRGEVGMSSEDIERFESLGYVMSGIRNCRMNKARVKKEQMLYTVEEKKALAIYNMEEKQRRERNIINEMKIMWKSSKDDNVDEEN